jgi:hypothetical protein
VCTAAVPRREYRIPHCWRMLMLLRPTASTCRAVERCTEVWMRCTVVQAKDRILQHMSNGRCSHQCVAQCKLGLGCCRRFCRRQPVPVQMWHGAEPGPGADVAAPSPQSRRRCGGGWHAHIPAESCAKTSGKVRTRIVSRLFAAAFIIASVTPAGQCLQHAPCTI